jgi:hypothetical protein
MSAPWSIKRSSVARPDGARRWDTAYQLLLQWGKQQPTGALAAPGTTQKEESHEYRLLRPGLDPPTTADPHD